MLAERLRELEEIARRATMLLDAVCEYEMLHTYDAISTGAELNAVASIRDKARQTIATLQSEQVRVLESAAALHPRILDVFK